MITACGGQPGHRPQPAISATAIALTAAAALISTASAAQPTVDAAASSQSPPDQHVGPEKTTRAADTEVVGVPWVLVSSLSLVIVVVLLVIVLCFAHRVAAEMAMGKTASEIPPRPLGFTLADEESPTRLMLEDEVARRRGDMSVSHGLLNAGTASVTAPSCDGQCTWQRILLGIEEEEAESAGIALQSISLVVMDAKSAQKGLLVEPSLHVSISVCESWSCCDDWEQDWTEQDWTEQDWVEWENSWFPKRIGIDVLEQGASPAVRISETYEEDPTWMYDYNQKVDDCWMQDALQQEEDDEEARTEMDPSKLGEPTKPAASTGQMPWLPWPPLAWCGAAAADNFEQSIEHRRQTYASSGQESRQVAEQPYSGTGGEACLYEFPEAEGLDPLGDGAAQFLLEPCDDDQAHRDRNVERAEATEEEPMCAINVRHPDFGLEVGFVCQ